MKPRRPSSPQDPRDAARPAKRPANRSPAGRGPVRRPGPDILPAAEEEKERHSPYGKTVGQRFKAARSPEAAAPEAQPRLTATKHYREGSKAFAKSNWDLAIEHFAHAVRLAPKNASYRMTLRAAQCRKYKQNLIGDRTGRGRLVRLMVMIAEARKNSDWDRMDRLAEDGLTINPWHAEMNAAAGEACFARNYGDAARFCYETALGLAPQSEEFKTMLARCPAPTTDELRRPTAKTTPNAAADPAASTPQPSDEANHDKKKATRSAVAASKMAAIHDPERGQTRTAGTGKRSIPMSVPEPDTNNTPG